MTEVQACCRCGAEHPRTLQYFSRGKSVNGHVIPSRVCQSCLEKKRAAPKGHKLCPVCLEWKPRTEKYFVKDKNRSGGLTPQCRECRAKCSVERYKKDGERLRTRAREAWASNKNNINEYHKMWKREYYKDPVHQESRRTYGRRAYYNNREKRIAGASKLRAKRLGIWGNFDGKHLNAIFRVQNGKCFYCGERVGGGKHKRWHADHYIPISRGGDNDWSNIVIACDACNMSKGARFPWEWLPDRFQAPPDQQAAD